MGPELPGHPSEHKRGDPRTKNREHVQRTTSGGVSYQDQRAQHTSGEQPRGRYGATPCHDSHCEICGTDVRASSQIHGEVEHRESQKQIRPSDDRQREMEQALVSPGAAYCHRVCQ